MLVAKAKPQGLGFSSCPEHRDTERTRVEMASEITEPNLSPNTF